MISEFLSRLNLDKLNNAISLVDVITASQIVQSHLLEMQMRQIILNLLPVPIRKPVKSNEQW